MIGRGCGPDYVTYNGDLIGVQSLVTGQIVKLRVVGEYDTIVPGTTIRGRSDNRPHTGKRLTSSQEQIMRKIVYALSVSLDGFVEAANGDLSWGNTDEELFQHFIEREAMFDTHLYGRRLYENMAAFWPTADENPSAPKQVVEYAKIWKNIPNIVFSRTLDQVGGNSRLVRGNIADEVNELKAQAGQDLIVGGAELAASFMQLGLIDEFWLYVCPVILGSGKPMFRPLGDKLNLQLVETRTFGSGVVLLRYQKADERQ